MAPRRHRVSIVSDLVASDNRGRRTTAGSSSCATEPGTGSEPTRGHHPRSRDRPAGPLPQPSARRTSRPSRCRSANPDLLPRRWGAINTALGNPWWAGAVKFCLGTIQVLADVATAPWTIPKDLLGAVSADTALHGSFEIRTAAFPVKAQELAATLRERQHSYAVRATAAATSSSPSTADTDQR